ncbi:MAG: acyl carrier protein [Planctomycetota bacterium]
MAMTKEEIYEKVQGILVEALGVDDDEVTPEAKIEADLGAESIDYLDILFHFEKEFGLKIDQAELRPEAVLANEEYVNDGKITDAGMAELKKQMPFADFATLEASRSVEDFSDIFTVQVLVNFVAAKLDEQG